MPYGYYTLLRLVACAVFGFAAFIAFERKSKVLPWLYAILALLFNPIIKVYLPKEMWAIMDVASGIFLLATSKTVRKRP